MTISSLEKSLKILEHLVSTKGGARLSDIAKNVSMTPAAAYKHIETFIKCGYIYRDETTSKYYPTYKIADMSSMILRNNDIHEVEHPLLTKLNRELGMTCHFAVYTGYCGTYIDKIESADTIPTISRIGMKRDLYCTAFGKAILSRLDDRELSDYLSKVELRPMTDKTITDRARLVNDLKISRERNYAIDREENELGIICIGSAVTDYTGHVVGAASAIIPLKIMNEENIKSTAGKIISTAGEISQRLGRKGEKNGRDNQKNNK
jgi:IclR family KDG regulon transcriptional repressor